MKSNKGIDNNSGSLLCVAIIAWLLTIHSWFWFFQEFSDGGHVSGTSKPNHFFMIYDC